MVDKYTAKCCGTCNWFNGMLNSINGKCVEEDEETTMHFVCNKWQLFIGLNNSTVKVVPDTFYTDNYKVWLNGKLIRESKDPEDCDTIFEHNSMCYIYSDALRDKDIRMILTKNGKIFRTHVRLDGKYFYPTIGDDYAGN